jgi:hypothetical protein
MERWCVILASAMVALGGAHCDAQWYGGYRGYGYRGYTQAATPYSAAVRSQAQLTMARGAAAEDYAKAAVSTEQARSLYLDNEAKFIQLRRANRDAKDARIEQEKQEQKARAALRPPPKRLTELYSRLSSDQIDPLTGEIHWPDCLSDGDYAIEKKTVEDALRTQAEYGPNDRTTKTIYDASHRMMHILSGHYGSLGPENYAPCRRFLNSLSVEGDYAQEALK